MWQKFLHIIYGKECEFRERILRSIVLIGGVAAVVASIEIFMVMQVNSIFFPLVLLLLATMAVSMFATFKYRKYDLAAWLIGVVIIAMVFPPLFCLSGGIDSGASIWMALGIIYIFIMFTGKKLVFFLILSTIAYGVTYLATYYHPELIIPMESRGLVYVDSFFSVLVVGFCTGMIVKIQMKVFEDEHQLNIIQKKELETNSNSKNVFFANMSHEIRTPINAIIGLNEMILRENLTGATREYAKDIQLASKMLLNQVNDILDLSQVEMKKMKIVPIQYRTSELFGDLVELVRVQLEKKGLDFYIDIDSNLPSVLNGDEKRLKQILLNILDNAVKYTNEGSVILSAHGEENVGGEITLKIKIADTGIGIRKEDIEYIYDSFNRVDENNNIRIVGSGLGLAITKQLVDLMGGEITVDSIYTKGTVFTVSIRQKIEDDTPMGVIDFLKRGTEDGEYYRPMFEASEARVLVVDDNNMNTMVMSKLLSSTKVQVDIARGGVECLEMTSKKYYHIILMDYMMPVMTGTETMKAIRSQENGLCRDTPIIVMTANTGSEVRQKYLDEGFDGYVEKPVQTRILEAEILKFMPLEIVEYMEADNVMSGQISQMQKTSIRKRKKICITSDCACDIPAELLEKYDIKLMYLYIKTPNGRFADTREIDADSLRQYMSEEGSTAFSGSVTVEEFEEFFSQVLTEADSVIHISLGSKAGQTHYKATSAAKSFDHVHIIDSGQISCGQGLITLHAAKLAFEGGSIDEICKEIENMKERIHTGFILPGAEIFYQNERTSATVANVCRVLQLHPMGIMRHKRTQLTALFSGSMERAWRLGIRMHLFNKKKISKKVVFITHVGCSVEQQEWILNEVKKYIKFERVIINKASFTNSCNSGIETVGIAYYTL